ncbi:hypothetical protein B7494_g3504 [Chlorociboria aeruginascens]|nr:hypothetical protein B7494_g3504 [Chlorociboria aeruginascens]
MVQSLPRSLLRLCSPPFLSPLHRRCFSRIPPQWAKGPGVGGFQPSRAPDPSLKVVRGQLDAMDITTSELGLLPGTAYSHSRVYAMLCYAVGALADSLPTETFVTPTRPSLPSIFHAPRQLFKMHWARIRYHIRDRLSLLIMKWTSPKQHRWFRRTLKVRRGRIAPTAVALHRQMYSALAEGDLDTLRKICADGIYDTFKARIAARPRRQQVHWDVVRYNRRAKVVAHRAGQLPREGSMIVQAVVRIDSWQKLTRYNSTGGLMPGTGEEKSIVEYLVLQKIYQQWKEGDWHVWGTTDGTTIQDVERWADKHLD